MPTMTLTTEEAGVFALLLYERRNTLAEVAERNGIGRDERDCRAILARLWRKLDRFSAELEECPDEVGRLLVA